MIWCRSLLFQAYFYGLTAVLALTATPAILFGRGAVERVTRLWARGVLLGLKIICRLDFEFRGLDRLPPRPYLVAAKHQSAWDTVVFALAIPGSVYVLKAELLHIPFYGWACRRLGHIPVDRRGGAGAMRGLLRRAARTVERGDPIVIFPEGTRVAPGETRRYQPGVSALYAHLDIPVVPVGLNSGLFWPRRSFLRHPGKIVLEIGQPIEAGLARKTFSARLEAEIEAITRRLEAEAGFPAPPAKENRESRG
ncbi:MAG: lysophospholipid acyltransferase family protein [Alphaproteobacteria bacterium]